MNDIFADMIDVIVIIYLDDILIYSDNISEHKFMLRKYFAGSVLMDCLLAQTMQVPCHFCEYLGYMLSPEGLTMAPYKVQIIQGWPNPRKVKDIHPSSALPISTVISFMDIPKSQFRSRVLPARVPLAFSDECHSAFEALKKAFTTALVLTHWILETQ